MTTAAAAATEGTSVPSVEAEAGELGGLATTVEESSTEGALIAEMEDERAGGLGAEPVSDD